VTSSLTRAPFEPDLGPAVACAGFEVVDHEAIVAELAALQVEGVPVRAVAKRRAEFLTGRFAARAALAVLGVESMPGRNEDGSPRWPAQISGSITHGAERAFCAVARQSDVRSLGIDVERVMGPETKAELAARICNTAELEVLGRGLRAPEHHLVSLAFSAKESLYKCLYPLVGRYMDFGAARVVAAEAGRDEGARLVGELTLALSVDWSPELPRGRQLRAQFVASERHVQSAVLLLA
jgi:enterobactin synthetase component D